MESTFKDLVIDSLDTLEKAVVRFGILPFFVNGIEGFSVEEHILPEFWFGEQEGAWDWKGSVIRDTRCAYGKLFGGKACFMRLDLYRELANFRRDGYDFDARYDDGLAKYADKQLYDLIDGNAPVISKHLKKLGDYRKGGNKGFDSTVSRLQAQCYVLTSDFVYMTDRYGEPYGWGLAEYSTPERFFGSEFSDHVYDRDPQASYDILFSHIKELCPSGADQVIHQYLKKG
ncbi:MAG: hypothetical protein IJ080_03250 [Oscillospiraceae bacterium]|nr:hypothetical protein [Oscillospiraceae bacterium]